MIAILLGGIASQAQIDTIKGFDFKASTDTFNVWFDQDKNEIDRIECVNPIVLRSDILHTVEIGKRACFPRIQMSFCFYNEPIDYLR